MVTRKTKSVARLGAALTAAALTAPLLSVAGSGAASASRLPFQGNYPRGETLYTSGTAYSQPTNFNPNDPGGGYTGTMGLLYEPLFLYDPIHGGYKPWIATSGKWVGNSYVLQVRNGVDWVQSPSQNVVGTVTGNDVAFSIKLAMSNPSDPWNSNVSGVASVSASGQTVTVNFKGIPPTPSGRTTCGTPPCCPPPSGAPCRRPTR